MARPRAFDEAVVLEKATRVFWEKGYEATSLCDLTAATGLGKGSLYGAFGDKRRLFLRSLRTYLDSARVQTAQALATAASPRAGLEEWLRKVGSRACTTRNGCFGVNSVIELGAKDADVRALMADHDRQHARLIAEVLARGIEDGEFRPDLDPMLGASHLLVVAHGLVSAGRAHLDGSEVEQLVRLSLDGLS